MTFVICVAVSLIHVHTPACAVKFNVVFPDRLSNEVKEQLRKINF